MYDPRAYRSISHQTMWGFLPTVFDKIEKEKTVVSNIDELLEENKRLCGELSLIDKEYKAWVSISENSIHTKSYRASKEKLEKEIAENNVKIKQGITVTKYVYIDMRAEKELVCSVLEPLGYDISKKSWLQHVDGSLSLIVPLKYGGIFNCSIGLDGQTRIELERLGQQNLLLFSEKIILFSPLDIKP